MKLTPAKRLKQLKQNGWLEFVEFMELHEITPRDVAIHGNLLGVVKKYCSFKTASWIASDIERDIYINNSEFKNITMVGLSEQVSKPKNNKMVKKGKYEQ